MNIFFNFSNYSNSFLLVQTLAIAAIYLFLLWLINIIVIKVIPEKLWSKYSREFIMKYALLISLCIVSLLYNFYIYFIFKQNGYSFLIWSATKTYMIISPHIIMYVLMISLFIISYSKFKSLTSGKR
jgi:hypothetical protein